MEKEKLKQEKRGGLGRARRPLQPGLGYAEIKVVLREEGEKKC